MRDIGVVKNDEPADRLFTQGMVIKNGAKMSKSLGNTVSPGGMVARYGADATRMYTLFAAPPDRDLDWQDAGVEGVSRFLSRVYRFVFAQRTLTACHHGVAEGVRELLFGGAATGIALAIRVKRRLSAAFGDAPSDVVILSEREARVEED